MSKTYIFHTDPGHGWLAVKRAEINRLGLADKISSFSYQKGNTVYLEEDCDAGLFIEKKKELGEKVVYRTSHQENTPIRYYQCYSPVL